MSEKNTQKKTATGGRTWARLAAIQAVYQHEFMQQDIEKIIDEFLLFRIPHGKESILDHKIDDGSELVSEIDIKYFCKLTRGTIQEKEDLDKKLEDVLTENWSMDRLDPVLKAILRLGIYEILHCDNVPKKVTISEFMSISDTFYGDKEPSFINGILDQF